MAKARGRVTRTRNAKPPQGQVLLAGLPEIEIGAWRPTDDAPPEQVHLIFHLQDLPPIVVRFKSPDTLGFLVEELARYRREVWPEAEPLALSGAAAPVHRIYFDAGDLAALVTWLSSRPAGKWRLLIGGEHLPADLYGRLLGLLAADPELVRWLVVRLKAGDILIHASEKLDLPSGQALS